jgi:hypothetical protein
MGGADGLLVVGRVGDDVGVVLASRPRDMPTYRASGVVPEPTTTWDVSTVRPWVEWTVPA